MFLLYIYKLSTPTKIIHIDFPPLALSTKILFPLSSASCLVLARENGRLLAMYPHLLCLPRMSRTMARQPRSLVAAPLCASRRLRLLKSPQNLVLHPRVWLPLNHLSTIQTLLQPVRRLIVDSSLLALRKSPRVVRALNPMQISRYLPLISIFMIESNSIFFRTQRHFLLEQSCSWWLELRKYVS